MIHYKGETGKVITPAPLGWDITGYTITVYVIKPDLSMLTKSGTIVDAGTGQVSWTTLSTDINAEGQYSQQVKAVNGTIVRYAPAELFSVESVLA